MQNLQNVLDRYRVIAIFLTLVLMSTIAFAAIFFSSRNSLRQQANDPQVEVTEQVAGIMRQGAPLDAIVSGAEQIDLATSDTLFVALYDKDKNLAGATATVNGQPLSIPAESFDQASVNGGYRFDWVVTDGREIAGVMKQVDDLGYVVAGRSLAEYELRVAPLFRPLLIGWIASILLSLFLASLLRPLRPIAIVEETNVTVVESGDGQ